LRPLGSTNAPYRDGHTSLIDFGGTPAAACPFQARL
jgi:hypothetical protein